MDYIRTVRQLDFTKLWLAQIFSQVAQHLLNFALIILVYDLTVGSRFGSFSVSLVVLAFTIPSILFAPAAGTFVDHWDRKKVLMYSSLARTVLVLLYITVTDNLILILILTFLTSTVTQFFVPAEAATIPKVVDKKYLLPANSLFVFTLYTSFIVGYSASGPVVRALGEQGPYLATAAMFGLATLLVALLPPQPRAKKADKLPKLDVIRHLRENWGIITADRHRYYSVLQLAVTNGVVFVLITLAPALSLALLKVPLMEASHIVVVPIGLGMVIGVLLINTIAKRISKITIIQTCLIVASISLILVGLTGQLYRTYHGDPIASITNIALIVSGLMLLLGMINSMVSAAAQTLIQETTDDSDRGKVFGSLNLVVNIAATVPVFITGLLADLISVTKAVVLIGAVLLAYSIVLFWRHGFMQLIKNKIQRPAA